MNHIIVDRVTPSILYVPGFGSDHTSSTFLAIQKRFRGPAIVECLSYDNFNPKSAEEGLLEQVSAHYLSDLPFHDHVLLVGSSFGGYWANQIASKLNLPFILVNPCLRPKASPTLKEAFKAKRLSGNMKDLKDSPIRPDLSHFVLLGGQDTIVPPEYAAECYPNHQIYPAEGHRFTDLEPLLTKIHNHVFVSP